ncbi:hypothetical protein CFP56_017867 [Quercus suber]|uniref:Uncharacterized protein n=1 Tax=Quercus suber TaxID=58331 RepID=A0AAW0KKV6_QUESU
MAALYEKPLKENEEGEAMYDYDDDSASGSRFSNSIGDEEIQIESHIDNNDYRGIDRFFNTSLLYQIWDP